MLSGWCITLGHAIQIWRNTLHSDVQCGFLKNTILGRIVWFLILHCIRTYSTIFDLYYTRMYNMIFDLNIILGRIIWFFLFEYYTRAYNMIFDLNIILGRIIWFLNIILGRIIWFLGIEYYTQAYNMIFDLNLNIILGRIIWFLIWIWLRYAIIIPDVMNAINAI